MSFVPITRWVQVSHLSPPDDAVLLLPLVHALVDEHVQAAHHHGPIPPVRSPEFLTAHPDQQTAALLIAGTAWIVADPHRTYRTLLRQTSHDVHGGDTTFWRRIAANHIPHTELERRRALPGPALMPDTTRTDHRPDRRPTIPPDPHPDRRPGHAHHPVPRRQDTA
ncbi:MAG: hypothetical protein ACRDRH_09380 [Pseudonocardia sp.]